MDKLANLEWHIKNMNDRCLETNQKLMKSDHLAPDEIVVLWKKQLEYQQAETWLRNVKEYEFPPKIIAPNGNGIH